MNSNRNYISPDILLVMPILQLTHPPVVYGKWKVVGCEENKKINVTTIRIEPK